MTGIELLPDGPRRAALRAVLGRAAPGDAAPPGGTAPPGYDEARWDGLGAEGWLTAAGPGGRAVDLAELASELGRARVPSPLHTTVEAAWVGAPVGSACCFSAAVVASGGVVGGRAAHVPYAEGASVFVVLTGASDLVVVAARARGVTVRVRPSYAGDRQADVAFDGVPVDGVLASGGDAGERVTLARRRATLSRSAEAVGATAALVEATAAHAATRVQFGGPIGRLQAVQHRCADMVMDHLAAAGAVEDAAAALDAGGDAELELAAAAALVSSAGVRVADSAHRVWGGTGYLAEAGIHRWTRVVRGVAAQLGGAHSRRVALAAGLAAGAGWSTHAG